LINILEGVDKMLTRWDPFREMMVVRNNMDRMFNRDLTIVGTPWKSFNWSLALDVVESDDEYVVKASLPGINPDDLDITFDDNRLTIKGELEEEQELDEARYHLRERKYGKFVRSIQLPKGIESDKIEASYEKGVLSLHLPKAEEIKPKKIAIKTVSPNIIESEASDITSKN
jgi:HSP20 family protein